MTPLIYPTLVSILFSLLTAEAVVTRSPALAPATFAITFVLWLSAYLAPPRLFRYTNDQIAPVVLSQLMKRAGVAIACVIGASVVALAMTGLWSDLPFITELYAFTLIAIILFHGFCGPFAYHTVYLQETKQYNSNQLAAVLIAFTFMLFIFSLFFLNLDFSIVRDAHIQRRDLLMLTTVFVGYGWGVYKMAHH